jgi:hypothetical protein
MVFRLAIGTCDCAKPYKDEIQTIACEAIEAQLQHWRPRLPPDLNAVPTEHWETTEVQGYLMTFAIHKIRLESGSTLVVFQALVHTWSRPTYLTLSLVGRLYAEGLLVSDTGVEDAPDDLMWEFR